MGQLEFTILVNISIRSVKLSLEIDHKVVNIYDFVICNDERRTIVIPKRFNYETNQKMGSIVRDF